MKKFLDYSIVIISILVLCFGILRFYHIRMGIFYNLFPVLFAILILLVIIRVLHALGALQKQ